MVIREDFAKKGTSEVRKQTMLSSGVKMAHEAWTARP